MSNIQNFRILQVSASLETKLGGPAQVVQHVFKYLTQKRIITKLLVIGNSETISENHSIIPTFSGNRYGFFSPIHNSIFKQEIRNSDRVLIHGFYLYSTLLSIRYSKHQKLFLMPHGSLEMYQERNGRMRKYIFRKVVLFYLNGRKIHFLLGSDQEVVSVKQLFPNSPISVVGLGIERYPYQRAKLTHKQTDPVILYCMSRITSKKRIDLCIRALSRLIASGGTYRLDIFGTGDDQLESELRALVKSLQLDNFVNFVGFVEDERKEKALRDSDIFLLPSENENFAVAVAESIAAGNPVIVSEFVAMHNFVDKYATGLTVSTLDSDDIALAIETIASKYQNFHANCLKFAHLLEWQNVIQNWIHVICQDLEKSNEK